MINRDFHVHAVRALSCAVVLFGVTIGRGVAQSTAPISVDTVLKADFTKNTFTAFELLSILGQNKVPVILETAMVLGTVMLEGNGDDFERPFALPKGVSSVDGVLRAFESQTGLKCALTQGVAYIHDPAIEKNFGADPLETTVSKIELREASIYEALDTLSKLSGIVLQPQFISHGVMNRSVTLRAENITIRQVLLQLSQKFNVIGGYTVVLRAFPNRNQKLPPAIGVSL